jgi:hypothetical protein
LKGEIVKTKAILVVWLVLFSFPVYASDNSHGIWDELVAQHVSWNSEGVASSVDYLAFKQQHSRLNEYLAALSAVTTAEYNSWNKSSQLAFLINAYNAFTVELILTKYPQIESIKDLGSLFSSPWKKKFFSLLGQQRSLDEIEHKFIRQPGVFDDPRIHAAVVCASIGCPGLRDEAFMADRLDVQLEDNLRRFLADRSRNRFNPKTGKLEVSKIFDWYGDDFIGFREQPSVALFLGTYAELLADDQEGRLRVAAGDAPLEFLEYDWRLNDVSR